MSESRKLAVVGVSGHRRVARSWGPSVLQILETVPDYLAASLPQSLHYC